MKKSKGIVVLLLTLILTVFFCFTAAVGIGPTGTGAAKHINTGLDLAGGVSITYQAKESNPTSEEMSDTIYKLQKRVEQYSTEAQVYQEGSDRITVEIPGVTDTILNDLGKPGSLYFITKEDADGNQNFTTGQDGYVLSRTMDEIKESGSVVLEGSDVADAQGGAIQNQNTSAKEYVVSLTLTSDGENSGKTKFAEATKNNVGKQIAIVYDNNIISAPNVNEEISGGKAQISGMSDLEEAQNLASYIRIGSLGLELEELRSSVVAAQLGEEAISTSVLAGAIGLIIVIIFMIIAYRVLQCQFYVLQRCKIRHQIIELEYKSNIISPITGKLPAVIPGNIPAIHQNFSAGSLIHTPKNVQHCRLARTAGTNDHYELSLGNLKADLIHCNDLYFFGSIYLGNLIQFYICICHLAHPHFPCNFIFATPVILFCYNY